MASDLSQRSASEFACGDLEWRADLGDLEAPHPLVKERPIAPVTIIHEKASWLPIPAAAFDDIRLDRKSNHIQLPAVNTKVINIVPRGQSPEAALVGWAP